MRGHKGQYLFAALFGLGVALLAYRWATDPAPRAERAAQEGAVMAARAVLEETLAIGTIEIVDPLAPDRKVGKTYVYPSMDGWQVSGFYRRGDNDRWHPYLLTLDAGLALVHLKVADGDAALAGRAAGVAALEVLGESPRTADE